MKTDIDIFNSIIFYLAIGSFIGVYYYIYYIKLDDWDFKTKKEMLLSLIPGAMLIIRFIEAFKECYKKLK